jgi:hypothetical protein
MQGALVAYNRGIQDVFIVSTSMACVAITGTLGMEWAECQAQAPGRDDRMSSDCGFPQA